MTLRVLIFSSALDMAEEYHHSIATRHPELDIVVATTMEDAAERLKTADILVCFGAHVRWDFFGGAQNLKWVHALGTGLDGITDQPGLAPHVLVTATRGIHGPTLSEMGLMLMLALSRDLPRHVRAQDKAVWDRMPARLLRGKTVGILGVGQISEMFGPLCKAFGMNVVGFSRTARPLPGFDRIEPRDDLEQIVPELDYLVLLIPSTPETHGIVSRRVLAAMKPTAFLINLARGAVVDEAALIETLRERRIGGAGLDAFLEEPLPPTSPLWHLPNTIVTPHCAGYNDEYAAEATAQFSHNLAQFIAGTPDNMTHLEPR
jgi:phosphoglycerate dehydrogenase-like enzyme